MSLFIVQHKHSAENCPARDAQMAPMLLKHLSKGNAEQAGIKVLSEAVIDGGHSLHLTLEASDKESVDRFMQLFAQVGTVEIYPASKCETVVDRGSC
ncbi:MAG: DUF3303 family protein [Ignavibacteriales bacterium]|nr:DUF3303 family protein [Ignavibacteriales bacterium]